MNYKPNNAYAGWVGLLMGIIIFGFALWGINFALDESDRVLKIMLLIPTYLLLVLYLFLIIGAFGLGYKVDQGGLLIKWGLYNKRIAWDQVDEIIEVKGRANLSPFLAASWVGYMVGVYSAKGLGSIRMFAADARQGFIFIKTKQGFYGLTPADNSMLQEILNKTGKPLEIVDMNKMSPEEKGKSFHDDSSFELNHKLNVIFLGVLAAYIAIFYPGSGAPRFIILLLVLAMAMFVFNVGNAKRIYQFSPQGAYFTLLMGLAVTGIFILLSVAAVSLKLM